MLINDICFKMFLKEKRIRVCVTSGFSACRLMCSANSKEREFSVNNYQSILQFKDIPTTKRLPLIGRKFDFLLTGFGKRFALVA